MTAQVSRLRTWRPVVGVLAAIAFSQTGTKIAALAIPWFVLVSTGSVTKTGLVVFCEMGPYVLVKTLAAPLVDRVGPRRVSWMGDVVSAAALATVPLLNSLGHLPFWALLVLVGVVGTARGPGDQAKEVMILYASDISGIPLERATGLAGVMERLASTLGPSIGAGLVAVLDPSTALLANTAVLCLGTLSVTLGLPAGIGVQHPAGTGDSREGYWSQLRSGVTFLARDRLLLAVILLLGLTNMLNQALTSVLLPTWALRSDAGVLAVGLANSTRGVTAICGSLLAAIFAHRMRRRRVFFVSFLLAGAPMFWILAAGAPLWAVLVTFAMAGFGIGFINPILSAVRFERVPRPLVSRVVALTDSIAWAGIPFGGLCAALAVASLGLVPALIAAGALYLAATNVVSLRPEWHAMDDRRKAAP